MLALMPGLDVLPRASQCQVLLVCGGCWRNLSQHIPLHQSPSLNVVDQADAEELSSFIPQGPVNTVSCDTGCSQRDVMLLSSLANPIFSPPFSPAHASLSEVFISDLIAAGQRSAFPMFIRALLCELWVQPRWSAHLKSTAWSRTGCPGPDPCSLCQQC